MPCPGLRSGRGYLCDLYPFTLALHLVWEWYLETVLVSCPLKHRSKKKMSGLCHNHRKVTGPGDELHKEDLKEDSHMLRIGPSGVRTFFRLTFVAAVATFGLFLSVDRVLLAQDGNGEQWVGTWATATVARAPQPESADLGSAAARQPTLNFKNQTLRQIVRTTVGGTQVRVVLSNTFGTTPLAVGGAMIARRETEAVIVMSSARTLTFNGHRQINIPAGAVMLSDPVELVIPTTSDLVIDLYLPDDTGSGTSSLTMHTVGLQTSFVSVSGNHVGVETLPVMNTMQSWFFLASVEVMTQESDGVVVTFGDSITDGTRSTPDSNNRWPDRLAKRLIDHGINMSVLNTGIAANRILGEWRGVNALARFDRDVLTQSGVTHVVVLEGINDLRIDPSVTADDLIGGYRQLIARAHARGLQILGATLLPSEGNNRWTPELEMKRQAINQWIRDSGEFDGTIDFDAVVRDPNEPSKLLPEYDSGDHIHPSDTGYRAMGEMVNLELFRDRVGLAQTSK